jgi:hypothetical protein
LGCKTYKQDDIAEPICGENKAEFLSGVGDLDDLKFNKNASSEITKNNQKEGNEVNQPIMKIRVDQSKENLNWNQARK